MPRRQRMPRPLNWIPFICLFAVAVPAYAQEQGAQTTTTTTDTTTITGASITPTDLKDETYVTLSGTVGEILEKDEFNLRYSKGNYVIKVDTNDYWPGLFTKDALDVLKPGDKITVTGVVDDNFFTNKEIDATAIAYKGTTYSRVYWNTPYDVSYQGYWPYYGWDDSRYDDSVSVSGVVSKIMDDDEFQMKYGTSFVTVDLSGLDIVDSDMLRVGDRVMVYGDMDDNWFTKRELEADYLVRTNVYQPRSTN